MSLIDELKSLEDRVAQRMAELRPLVHEYHELEEVAERLGMSQTRAVEPSRSRRSSGDPSRAVASPARTRARTPPRAAPATRNRTPGRTPARSAAATPKPRPAPSTRRPPARTRRGGRRDQLMDVVKAEPGITVRGVGTRLGVDPTSLYRIVHRLEQDGALRKTGRELRPA